MSYAYLVMSCLVVHLTTYAQTGTVNVVIGDESFQATYNRMPDENTSEQLRIQTHLLYVERLLASRNVDHLNTSQQQNRLRVIYLLHEYSMRGLYPVNEAYSDRKPCFIDPYGNICAVGYLVEQTAGREMAERINTQYQYDYIADMNEESIRMWADDMGLTLEECAMIQPRYGPSGPYPTADAVEQPLITGYGVTSGLLGGVNIGLAVANASSMRRTGSNRLAWIGMVTGAVQAIYGAIKVSPDDYLFSINTEPTRISYKANNNLSYINIATGTATFITSVINLGMRKKLPSAKGCVQIYSYPGINQKMNMGFSFTRSI